MSGVRADAGTNWRRPRGFTLIEIGTVLFIVVLLMGIAIPTIKSVTGMQVQTEISKLASNIRAARGHSAVAGETCRMVFDIEGGSYSLECAKGESTVAKETSKGGLVDKADKNLHQDDSVEAAKARAELAKKNAFSASKSLPSQTLKGTLKFVSVWTPHQSETYTKGKASLYFFPSGSSEVANIVLSYADEFYTVQVGSIAGNVRVLGEKAKLPDQEDWN